MRYYVEILVIVDDKKMPDAKSAMISEEERQSV